MQNNNDKLLSRVIKAAEESLQRNQYVSPLEVFLGMGLLAPSHLEEWRRGKIPYLEGFIQGSLDKINFVLKSFRKWAVEKGLKPSQTVYIRKTRGGRIPLRFSVSGNAVIEENYSTHYLSPELSEQKQKKLQEKMEKPPELTVFRTVREYMCSKCQSTYHKGSFLFLEEGQPLCLVCAKLNDLEYLPSGNSKLTRHVSKNAEKLFIVVEFSRSRKRYERQGILVDKSTLTSVKQKLQIDHDDDTFFT